MLPLVVHLIGRRFVLGRWSGLPLALKLLLDLLRLLASTAQRLRLGSQQAVLFLHLSLEVLNPLGHEIRASTSFLLHRQILSLSLAHLVLHLDFLG